ncbi:MAG: ATP-binding protein [Pyrinomonadaceae bacterium]
MLAPKTAKNYVSSGESLHELKFITELGRSLLGTVHPKRVALRVAENLRFETGADVCAVVAELEHIGVTSAAFDSSDEQIEDFLNRRNFDGRTRVLPSQVSYIQKNSEDFLLKSDQISVEYISPLHIDGEVKGAIITGFKKAENCTESKKRLIDAAAQMTAMSLNLSSHYEATINSSINQAREEHRKFTESVLDALPVSIYVIDRDYRIAMWNRHREIGMQGLPRDAVIGRNVFEVLAKYPHSKLSKEFERAFRTGNIERIEQRTTDDKGLTKHWMVSKVPMRDAVTGDITHVITVGEDVTMRVEAIHAVGRAEKLAAVGRLAAGVVHEINNPLATISACAESLQTRVEEGEFGDSEEIDDLKDYLGLIHSEAFRCKSITMSLLDFSRIRSTERQEIELSETVKSSARLLKHQKRAENIEIKLELADTLPSVNANEGQIQQAVISLATNAIDAMPEGGTLIFRALEHHNRVIIEIEDTGIGISPEDMSKIFEPFFTTKEVGKGTGLGLAVCYGIVTEHGGRVSVRSNIGKGTTFSIYLPVIT